VPDEYTFTRYLAAKKSVDDRALNRHVWQTLQHKLLAPESKKPLQVLELGTGIGTMVQRLLEWNLLSYSRYTAIDKNPDSIAVGRARLQEWAKNSGFEKAQIFDELRLVRQDQDVTVVFETIDLFDFIMRERERPVWDLLIAHAFLDLVDIPSTLPRLSGLIKPQGLFYFTINFDGLTVLEPTIDPPLDDLIQQLYHRTMDERVTAGKRSGDSQTGRHLFSQLDEIGAEILDAGPSDWIVFPTTGVYPADEAYFLHYIIQIMQQALVGHPELDAKQFATWIEKRHTQIENAELVYIAHQIDFVGRFHP
jgi:SAM-dependent methyltransferase